MPSSFERRTVSVIVRLWTEPLQQEGPPVWRGQIEHVATGERVYFQTVVDLLVAIGVGGTGVPHVARRAGIARALVRPAMSYPQTTMAA